MRQIGVLHERVNNTWAATSPEVPNWTIVADSYEEAHRLAFEPARPRA